MDAIKILGSLLANNALGSRAGGNIIGSLLGGGNQSAAGNILGALMGGRSGGNAGLGALGGLLGAASGRGGSGLGALAGLLGGGGGAPQAGGGLGDLVGGLLGGGGGGSAAGGLSSLLGGGGAAPGGGSGSDILSSLLGAAPGPVNEPPQEAHDEAAILIEAMCNAAKVDGQVDGDEQQQILGKLGDLEEEEVNFVRQQLSAPLDVQGFISRVPADMGQQVYAFSLMAIKLDSQAEAQYCAQLAQGFGIDANTANQIHEQLGEPQIFQ